MKYSKPAIILTELNKYLGKLGFKKDNVSKDRYHYSLSSPSLDNIMIEVAKYKDFVWFTLKTKYASSFMELYDLKVKDDSIDKTKIYVVRYNSLVPNFDFIKFILEINGIEEIINKNKNRIPNGL